MNTDYPLVDMARILIQRAAAFDARSNGRTWDQVRRAKEIGTIKLGSHRQAGHSAAITALATDRTMIVVPRLAMRVKLTPYTRSAGHVNENTVHEKGHDMILVDTVSLFSRAQLDQLYAPKFLAAAFPMNTLPLIVLFQ